MTDDDVKKAKGLTIKWANEASGELQAEACVTVIVSDAGTRVDVFVPAREDRPMAAVAAMEIYRSIVDARRGQRNGNVPGERPN